MRENVFTLFANHINRFANHNLTKEQLFNLFVECIAMADEIERKEAKEKNTELDSDYRNALEMLR